MLDKPSLICHLDLPRLWGQLLPLPFRMVKRQAAKSIGLLLAYPNKREILGLCARPWRGVTTQPMCLGPLINFWLSSDAEILLVQCQLSIQVGAEQKVYAMCTTVHVPTKLPFCIPPVSGWAGQFLFPSKFETKRGSCLPLWEIRITKLPSRVVVQ